MFTKHTHLSSKPILKIPKKQSFLTKKLQVVLVGFSYFLHNVVDYPLNYRIRCFIFRK